VKNIKLLFVTIMGALFVFATPQIASSQIAHGQVALQEGTLLAQAVERAETCEKAKDILTRELEIMSLECYGTSYKKKKACEDCGIKPVTKSRSRSRPLAAVCYGDAKKVGNSCSCDHMDPLPGTDGKPVPVKMKGSKSWILTIVCAYTAEDVMKYAMRQEAILEDVCKAGRLVGENADRIGESGANVALDNGLEDRCKRAGDILDALESWASRLQSGENDVPGLNRGTWETVWNLTAQLEKMLTDLNNVMTGVSTLCKPKDGEPLALACRRFLDSLGAELDGLHERDDEIEDRVEKVEKKVEGLSENVDRLSDNEWLVGVSPFGIWRFGEEVPRSLGANAVIEYRSWVRPRSGWLAGAHFGVASTNNSENHAVLGGRAGYLHALDANRNTAIFVGARGSAGIVQSGTNAADIMGQVGVQLCASAFCIEPWFALGGSSVVRRYDSVAERDAHMKWTGAAGAGVNVTVRLGGGSSSEAAEEPPKKEAPPPAPVVREEETSERSSRMRRRVNTEYRD